MTRHRSVYVLPRAVLAPGPASEIAGKFGLDGNSELQVEVSSPSSGTSQVDIQVTNSAGNLQLHWGALRESKGKWILPTRCPNGTEVYKNKALRTPFIDSGSKSFLKIEIDDPAIQAIEFLIFDEAQNKWFKNNGDNFYVKLSRRDKWIPDVSVPEDLVQVQSYLRWERKGKQTYTPEQEKEEYEAARTELLEEIASGTSVQEIRARLTNNTSASESRESVPSEPKDKIPDDLMQIQAYIHWEKAGKPNYSRNQQLREFEEARKDLQLELKKGTTLAEIRKKIMKGEIQTKVAKQLEKKSYFTTERIQRKKRDWMQLLNKHAFIPVEEKTSTKSQPLSAVALFAKSIYKLGNQELLVLVTKSPRKKRVHLATDFNDPVILHWALSKKSGVA